MSVLFPILLNALVLLVFFEAGRIYSRSYASRRWPGMRALFITTVLFVFSGFIPVLHSISLHAAVVSIASGYLDHFFFIFYAGAVMLLLSGNRSRNIRICLVFALAVYAAAGGSVTGLSDLSSDRIYTPRPYTQSLISSLDSECRITWYRSEPLARRMKGKPVSILLERLAALNSERITLAIIDPASHSDPGFAERTGLQPLEDASFSGVAIEYHGKRHLIPAVSDVTMLEYEIARFLEIFSTAGEPHHPVQMLLLGDPGNGYEQLQTVLQYAGFTLLPPDNPAAGLDVSVPLIVIGSQYAETAIADSIDRFLVQGGNAVFFVSGVQVDIRGDWTAREKKSDPVLSLLSRRGIDIPGTLIRDKSSYTIIMPALSDIPGIQTVPYPYWPHIKKTGICSQHPVFSGISGLQFFWPSPVFATTEETRILLTSGAVSQMDNPPFHTHPFDSRREIPSVSREPFPLGISQDSGGRLLVFPDEYALSELTDLAAGYDNLLFFINCAEWITHRETLTVLKRTPPALYTVLGRLAP